MGARPVVALVCLAQADSRDFADYLERRGYDVRVLAEDWMLETVSASKEVDVVVVGERLPPSTGLDLLRRHAGGGGPGFVMLSSSADLIDRVLALELGAADIVAAPVNWRELTARIAGIAALVMHRSGAEEQLSAGQVALLRLFLANPRKVLSRDDIMAAAPAESTDAFDRSIDSRIVRLRRKLDTESITTIRGSGYRFDPPSRVHR